MGKYSDQLAARLRAKSTPFFEFTNAGPRGQVDEKAALKGAKAGNCNVTACQEPGAVYFNKSTRAYYCAHCAGEINWPGGRKDTFALYGTEYLCDLDLEALEQYKAANELETLDDLLGVISLADYRGMKIQERFTDEALIELCTQMGAYDAIEVVDGKQRLRTFMGGRSNTDLANTRVAIVQQAKKSGLVQNV